MNYNQLGKRVREERQKLNLTQERLAEKVEVSDAYIGQIERGERSLSLETLIKIARNLGVTVDYLLQDTVEIDDEHFFQQMKQIMLARSTKEKQMVLDIVKLMFAHLDDLNSGK